jgi:isopenicillin N synthase-like dioxygenase
MATLDVKSTQVDDIPVIDITPLRDGSGAEAVALALLAASQNLGFIYIKGHGITDQVINTARAQAFDFFRSPATDKQRYRISNKHRGWIARGGAKMQDDMQADLKESFLWGYQDDAGYSESDHELRGPNQWPDFVPDLQQSAMDYFSQADQVARHLMQGFALGLKLDKDFFLRSCERPLSRASAVYYPAQKENSEQQVFGVGPHTDFGVLTVLCQDDTGGLQVENLDGEWIEAPPIEGTLVVNVGDLLERWTDGAFRSTPHRVINSSGKERLSLVLAFDPEPEAEIDAKAIYGIDYESKQPPISCGDYLNWRFDRAFSYRNKK